jgi:hypothetical protein
MSESWASWPVDLRSCCAADAWARLFFPAVPILLREANLTAFPPRSRKCSCIILWNAQSGSFALRGPVYKGLRVFFRVLCFFKHNPCWIKKPHSFSSAMVEGELYGCRGGIGGGIF